MDFDIVVQIFVIKFYTDFNFIITQAFHIFHFLHSCIHIKSKDIFVFFIYIFCESNRNTRNRWFSHRVLSTLLQSFKNVFVYFGISCWFVTSCSLTASFLLIFLQYFIFKIYKMLSILILGMFQLLQPIGLWL